MRTLWLFGLATALLAAGCSTRSAGQSPSGSQQFATMASASRGGLGASGANPCPQEPDAPEARAAIAALPPAQQAHGKRWSQKYTGRYDRCGALTAVVVALEGEGDPLGPHQVLLFHNGAFVGTAEQCASGRTEVKSARGNTVTVQYRWPRGQETATTMSGSANVKYRWSGGKVERADRIPEELRKTQACPSSS